jgi:hypothetical protein
MRNRTRATTTNNPFLPPKKHTRSFGEMMVGISDARRKRGIIHHLGTISREGMRYRSHTKQRLDFLEKQGV